MLNTMVPFVRGGAEALADDLLAQLSAVGVAVELIRLPFRWYPTERLLEEMLAARSIRLSGVDRVIGLKFPTYLVPHPNKVMWLVHQHRQAYDMWDDGTSDIAQSPRGPLLRAAIRAADARAFAECRALYTISANVTRRLRTYSGFEAQTLHMPLAAPEQFVGGPYGDYVFAAGRIGGSKRQALLVRAMALVRSSVRLIVAGPPDTPDDEAGLRALVAELGVADRVEIVAGFLPATQVAEYVNNALAVAYVPRDEDAIGYVTMEACQAAKPVIACTDSGGLLELLQDGVTGHVTEPTAAAVAEAIDRLAGDRAAAERMGHQAREALAALKIGWDTILPRLLG